MIKNKITKLFELFFTYYILYELKIESCQKDINLKVLNPDFKILILNSNEFYYFKVLKLSKSYLEIIKTRLDSPFYSCVAIIDVVNDKIAYYSWINTNDKYKTNEFYFSLNLKKHNSCLFEDDNTIEQYRGQYLHTFAMVYRIKYCKDKCIKKVLIAIHPRNIAAIKTIKKIGFNPTYFFPFKIRRGSFSLFYKKILK